MDSPKLNTLRKELLNSTPSELASHLLKIARYKTENKEFLHYLLFYSDNNDEYADDIKKMMYDFFNEIPSTDYNRTKSLRKLTRIMNKHIKFIADKKYEVELCCYFCGLFIENKIVKTHHKPLLNLLYRQLKRIHKLLPKLDEDLQFDYSVEFEKVIENLKKYKPYFDEFI